MRLNCFGDERFRFELFPFLRERAEAHHADAYAAYGWELSRKGEFGKAAFFLSEAFQSGYEDQACYGIPDNEFEGGDDPFFENLENARDEDQSSQSRLEEYEFLVHDLGYTRFAGELGDLYIEAWQEKEDIDMDDEEAWPKAMYAYCTGAVVGYYYCMYKLGMEFYNGRATDETGKTGSIDYERAVFWFQRSAKGYPESARVLGLCYEEGDGVPQSYEKAYECFELAARKDPSGAAKYDLARMYHNGEYVSRNYPKAYALFRESAERGYFLAAYAQAEMLYKGIGVAKDWRAAERLLESDLLSWYPKANELLEKIHREHRW